MSTYEQATKLILDAKKAEGRFILESCKECINHPTLIRTIISIGENRFRIKEEINEKGQSQTIVY